MRLSALVMLFLLYSSVSGQIDTLQVGNITARPLDGTVAVPVFLSYHSGCCFAHFQFRWDSEKSIRTRPLSILTPQESCWQLGLAEIDTTDRTFSVIGINAAPELLGSTTICYLRFGLYGPSDGGTIKILPGSEQRMGSCDGEGGTTAAFISGEINIASVIFGDVNASKSLSGSDVTYLVNYINGRGSAPRDARAADVNGDCAVNSLDVSHLINFFEGRGPGPIAGHCK